jgi:uncharacterized Zn-finger protein
MNAAVSDQNIIIVPKDSDQVKCEGGLGALGHPTVWYSFDGKDQVVCGYCSRVFKKDT